MTQPGKDPHCKDIAHLKVVLSNDAPQVVTATFIPIMACKNNEGYHSWGVVLSAKRKSPLNGLHLFPESVTWLPSELRAAVTNTLSTKTVTIQHTDLKVFEKFASLSLSGAMQLASDIETAAEQAPQQ